jgi:peptidoglycan/xylan/chitin deacetylase (PgdA/CDA1 family)
MPSIDKRQLLLKALQASGGLRVLENVHAWSGLLVLNYHRIGCSSGSQFDRAIWSATADDFDQQVAYTKTQCEIVGLDDLPNVMSDLQSKSRWNRSRFAMITFDDGYLDNFEKAYPVLRTHDVPGVFFITTGFLDNKRLAWWDEIAWMIRSSSQESIAANEFIASSVCLKNRDQAIVTVLREFYALPGHRTGDFLEFLADATNVGRASAELSQSMWMTWDHVREMRSHGMSIGAHTVNHPILARLPFEEQNFEICESRLRLEQELEESITSLSYPVGRRDSFNEDTRRVLSQNDFDWAFSYYGGYSKGQVDRFDVPRVAIESDSSMTDFRSFSALPQVFARH